MNRRRVLHNNSPVQQMMASVNNPSLWNINNLIKPPFTSSLSSLSPSNSSSSSITNFLSPSHNNININNINHNNNLISHNYQHSHHHSINSPLLHDNNQYNMNNNDNMSTITSSSSWLLDNNDDHQLSTNHINQEETPPHFHDSWSQLLLGGVFIGDEEKKLKNWEEQILLQQNHSPIDHVKQEISVNSHTNTNNIINNNIINSNNTNKNVYSTNDHHEFQAKWSPNQISIPTSSPQSCVTTAFNNNNNSMLDFSSKCISDTNPHPSHDNIPLVVPDHGYERDCATKGGASKKVKVQPSSSQSTFKVRKEKLGDRITALHQLVSPFGKTDTASVLLEAIGYIRFLHNQVEALSLPYLTSGSKNERQPYNNVQLEEKKCIFPEDPGQLLNENCLKRKGGPHEDIQEEAKDLRSRGLCLVPLACTMHVGNDNGADYWAPTFGGGFR